MNSSKILLYVSISPPYIVAINWSIHSAEVNKEISDEENLVVYFMTNLI